MECVSDRPGRGVFGVLYRLLGAAEPAEEVAQDAFHAVWRRAATYRADRGSVRTWLLAIARNKCPVAARLADAATEVRREPLA